MLELAYLAFFRIMPAHPELCELIRGSAVGAVKGSLCSAVDTDSSLPALDLLEGYLASVLIVVLYAFSGVLLCPDEGVIGFRCCSAA